MTYRQAQLKNLCPEDENEYPSFVRIKLVSDSGETKWLNVDNETFDKISKAILEMEGN